MNWPKTTHLCLLATAALAVFLTVNAHGYAPLPPQPQVMPPAPAREFRALWIATVENIDWPSKPGLNAQQQKAELIAILNRAASLNFNAVILQVRPACDAIYPSKIEPWSEYLTGQMGVAPKPYYDPLAFAVTEAHKRGLELHAWFNPYRARFRKLTTPISPRHVIKTHPQLIRAYGKCYSLDPGERETRDYSLSVVMDVVRRYDIDAVHFDDYFYPYPEKNQEFPDESIWRQYQASGGKLSKSDWRRDNVNTFVQRVYRAIKAEKPWVKFGISPFGTWQPGCPPQVKKGLNAYNEIYADSRKWLSNGWVDYLAPQLYWSITNSELSYPILLKWWAEQNTLNRNLWPGASQLQETASLVALTRRQPGASGQIFWHAQLVCQNTNGTATALRSAYAAPALIPPSPWLNSAPPAQPILRGWRGKTRMKLNWRAGAREQPCRWVVQKKFGDRWETEILPENQTSQQTKEGAPLPDAVAVSAVNRYGALSSPSFFSK